MRADGERADSALKESGGLSGPPLKPLSLRTLQTLYALTSGSIPLIGCGGISTGADAIEYAKSGASFVQFYTALGYQGVGLPRTIKDEIVSELKKDGKTWKNTVGSGVDLESIKKLGRDKNLVGLLNLEEDANHDFERLKQEIEDAISGKPRTQGSTDLHYRESPAAAAKSTVPSGVIPSSSDSESGLMPDGTPQIYIIEAPPSYKPARPWTREDVEKKWKESKDLARDVEDKLESAASFTQEAFKEAGSRFEKAAKDIKDDSFARDLTEGGNQAVEGLKQVGKEIKDDDVARTVADISRDAVKQAADGFRHVGQEIRDDNFAKEIKSITEDAVRQTTENFRKIGRDIKDDTFLRDVRDISEQAARQAKQNFEIVGRNIRDEGDFTAATKEVVADTIRRTVDGFHKIGTDIRDQGQFSKAVKEVVDDAVHEAMRNFREVGRKAKDEGDFSGFTREVTVDSARKASDGLQEVGRNVRNEGDFPGMARSVTTGAAQQASEGFQAVGGKIRDEGQIRESIDEAAQRASKGFRRVGKDIQNDSLLRDAAEMVKESVARAEQGFAKVGSDIANDPLLDKTKEVLRDMVAEANDVTERSKDGPSGEPQRSGGGLFSLFSTFGERRNVTSESKRQV